MSILHYTCYEPDTTFQPHHTYFVKHLSMTSPFDMDAISLALQVTVRISSSLFGHGVAMLAKPGSGFDASIEGPRVGLFKFFLAWY